MKVGYSGRNVLVTGAGGFIGSRLTERLVDFCADVTASPLYNNFEILEWLDDLPAATCRMLTLVRGDARQALDAALMSIKAGNLAAGRDFTYVDDAVAAVTDVGAATEIELGRPYSAGSGKACRSRGGNRRSMPSHEALQASHRGSRARPAAAIKDARVAGRSKPLVQSSRSETAYWPRRGTIPHDRLVPPSAGVCTRPFRRHRDGDPGRPEIQKGGR